MRASASAPRSCSNSVVPTSRLPGDLAVRVEDPAVAIDDERDVRHAAKQQPRRFEAGAQQLLYSVPLTAVTPRVTSIACGMRR